MRRLALPCLVGSVGLLAEFVPGGFGKFDAELFGGGFDVSEGLVAFGVSDIFDLVEAGDGVADVGGVVERLLALIGEGEGVLAETVALVGGESSGGLLCGGFLCGGFFGRRLLCGGHVVRMGRRWGMLLAP